MPDLYDPRKSDFIRPATDDEVVHAQVDLKRKQIARLQTLVARLDAQKQPNHRTSHYHETLAQLQHECQCMQMRQLSSASWETGSTAMPSRETSSPGSETSVLERESYNEPSMVIACIEEELPAISTTHAWRPGAERGVRDTDKASKSTPPTWASALLESGIRVHGAVRKHFLI